MGSAAVGAKNQAEIQALVLPLVDDDGQLRLVTGDPFGEDRIAAAEERIAQPTVLTLAHHADVAAYLARHEEGLSAMASLLPDVRAKGGHDAGVEDLSFQSITEDASPVVRLVRSTLYDALKADASDIHLETGAHGLAIKYRIDGVLVSVGQVGDSEVAEQAISRMRGALERFFVEGVKTNIPTHLKVLGSDAFARGEFDTHFLERL